MAKRTMVTSRSSICCRETSRPGSPSGGRSAMPTARSAGRGAGGARSAAASAAATSGDRLRRQQHHARASAFEHPLHRRADRGGVIFGASSSSRASVWRVPVMMPSSSIASTSLAARWGERIVGSASTVATAAARMFLSSRAISAALGGVARASATIAKASGSACCQRPSRAIDLQLGIIGDVGRAVGVDRGAEEGAAGPRLGLEPAVEDAAGDRVARGTVSSVALVCGIGLYGRTQDQVREVRRARISEVGGRLLHLGDVAVIGLAPAPGRCRASRRSARRSILPSSPDRRRRPSPGWPLGPVPALVKGPQPCGVAAFSVSSVPIVSRSAKMQAGIEEARAELAELDRQLGPPAIFGEHDAAARRRPRPARTVAGSTISSSSLRLVSSGARSACGRSSWIDGLGRAG